MLSCATGDMFGLVLLGAFTGQRLTDIGTLTWKNVDLQHGIIQFWQAKTKKYVVVPMHPQVSEYL